MSNSDDKQLFEEIRDYIEVCEVRIEGEWGYCRNLEEMIEDNSMPTLYAKVLRRIEELK